MTPDASKPFLLLQLRPEVEASDGEYAAILEKGGLEPEGVVRICLDRDPLPKDLSLDDYAGVIVGGGPGCVSDAADEKPLQEARIEAAILGLLPDIIARDFPYMGCCYGIGVLAHALGGNVSKQKYGEPVGAVDCTLTEQGRADPLLATCPDRFGAFVGHKEAVQSLPDGCVHLLASDPCPFQMIRHGQNVYATQFHPEADAAVFEQRVHIYRDKGYFPPETANALIASIKAADVTVPEQILRAFVTRYQGA